LPDNDIDLEEVKRNSNLEKKEEDKYELEIFSNN